MRERRRLWLTIAVACGFGAVAGVSLADRGPDGQPEPIVETAKAPRVRETFAMGRKQMPRPVRILIPSIKLSAPVVPLGLNPDRTLQVPTNFGDTGWFRGGPEPGEVGPAVIVGHVASLRGPAVFYRLREVRVGQVVTIRLQDRSTVRYVVNSMVRVKKNAFPTARVYSKTKRPTLRLITCAGSINPTTGHHPDNYILFASLVP